MGISEKQRGSLHTRHGKDGGEQEPWALRKLKSCTWRVPVCRPKTVFLRSKYLEGIFGSSCNRQPHPTHGVVKSSALKKECGVGSVLLLENTKCLQNIEKDDGIQEKQQICAQLTKTHIIQTLMFSSSLLDLPLFNKYLLSAYYTPGTGNVSSEKSRHNPCLPWALHCSGRGTLRRSQRQTLKSPGCLELSDTCYNRLKFLTTLPPLGSPVQF